MRVSSPPNIGPCYYGIDTPTRGELIAYRHSVEEIRDILGCDSLGYLSLEGLHRSARQLERGICDACFSASYPIPVPTRGRDRQLSLFQSAIRAGGDPGESRGKDLGRLLRGDHRGATAHFGIGFFP